MAAIDKATGDWSASTYEAIPAGQAADKNWGFVYRGGAHLNGRVEELANELQRMLADTKTELDNPIVLAKISALNGHYNGARQAQSNLMKSVKDTSQAIIRNM
ncbi:EscF/YscF/HrpA family type III secretion system needle major subunit [Yersinia mollaretii]|uniref:Type III secretion apparatus needle protein n=1 Tax=Yersinia mollaretii TaxID=33060 RepID=A0AA36LQF3_YERMO|nr:EscF/YscF/HrpA family type III secretion system needle major subunit [Yersinia mollaretii]MDA5537124.1 type III secretion apparatus needle protein [Yersinia mollaretii]MDN0112185.1 EscF/YscF/HrpA family type III secretion system needle major subunit [Yersinia mollaretii]NIL05024.1 type III secretion apparatus needle protein [Yersinia mollaretii]PJE86384.1 type III secretion apparatus needle protein [Yersinia mollaretii]CNH90098.1 Uncharacterised protein [Yersinia mollaretii]